MKFRIFLIILALVGTLLGDVTNVIDLAALVACGTGTTNGWEMSSIDAYSGTRTNIRFNAKNDFLISPDFNARITAITLEVRSSAQSNRQLALFPLVDGVYSTQAAQLCLYSTTNDKYDPQCLAFDPGLFVTRFRIALDDQGGSTAWAVAALTVITGDEPFFSGPTNIVVDHISASAASINWDSNDTFASNRVTVAKITTVPESFTVLADYDFENCVNTDSKDSDDRYFELNRLYPAFTAEKVYYPKQSAGILRISTSSANGYLTHQGFPNYANLTMAITAKRYTGDRGSRISVYYTDSDNQVHEAGSIAIGDDFTVGHVPLGDVPAGFPVSIGNLDGTHSNRRFLIDRIAFLKDYTPVIVKTNVISTVITSGDHTCRVHGLLPRSTYLATVTAFTSDGEESVEKPSVEFATGARPLVISVH